ncbi:basic membrane lipoprotein [Candidatus Vecturithrix granuli]|uniref:Basic membrane lipoprotein n=1 Tax=Vecturithrix granuli TaxID=1499967 RepID=A0A081BUJ4_VECG1|nr:basic membrane lipoprotein [Candidatus Vecturithrix granuli]
MNRKNVGIAVIVVVMVSLLVGGNVVAQPYNPAEFKAVLILPGPINDQGWNATNYSSLTAANEQLGTNIEYLENVQQQDFEATFRNYGNRGYHLVMAAGTQFDNAAYIIAPLYPETKYLIINGSQAQAPNLTAVTIREWEGGYLAGILAGLATKSGIIGEITAFPYPVLKDILYGVTAGAQAVNPNFKQHIRAFANSWDDVAKGKDMAASMIEQGADVIFSSANQLGLGSVMAVKEAGVKFIGYASNQNELAPDLIPGSVIYKYEALYTLTIKKALQGELQPEVFSVGLSDGVIDVAFSASATPEMQTQIQAAAEQIIAGTITKPEEN